MNAHRHSSRSTRAAKPAKTTAGAMSAPVGTVSELARAWFANQDATAGTEGMGAWKALDRALIETPATSREDVVALLEVVIRDFRTLNENAKGKLIFPDNGQELLWTAINAAHRLLTADDEGATVGALESFARRRLHECRYSLVARWPEIFPMRMRK